MTSSDLPKTLQPTTGPLPEARVRGSSACLGSADQATGELVRDGWVPPDLLTGMTLHVLANQPRPKRKQSERSAKKATPIDGSVWVREQATFHSPIAVDEAFTVEGASLRNYVRKGRLYGVTDARTTGADGRLCVSNLTTGLFQYQPVSTDENTAEADAAGVDADSIEVPAVDPSRAVDNPHLDTLRALVEGQVFEADPTVVTLALMQARDGENATNPIHSDAEAAARTGLKAPIAGGSHVLGFVYELLMRELGTQALMHGAHLDVRWRRPVYAETGVGVHAVVDTVSSTEVKISFETPGPDGPYLAGSITIPIG